MFNAHVSLTPLSISFHMLNISAFDRKMSKLRRSKRVRFCSTTQLSIISKRKIEFQFAHFAHEKWFKCDRFACRMLNKCSCFHLCELIAIQSRLKMRLNSSLENWSKCVFTYSIQLCDVILEVSGEKINAHRVVLASVSPYFYAMFNGMYWNFFSVFFFYCIVCSRIGDMYKCARLCFVGSSTATEAHLIHITRLNRTKHSIGRITPPKWMVWVCRKNGMQTYLASHIHAINRFAHSLYSFYVWLIFLSL